MLVGFAGLLRPVGFLACSVSSAQVRAVVHRPWSQGQRKCIRMLLSDVSGSSASANNGEPLSDDDLDKFFAKTKETPLEPELEVEEEEELPEDPVSKRPSFRAKQSLGQNFLVDEFVVQRILDATNASASASIDGIKFDEAWTSKGEHVVEIGPGTGSLTGGLLDLFPSMRAVEIDQRCVALLRDKFPTLSPRLEHGDVLHVEWNEMQRVCSQELGLAKYPTPLPKLCVVGNLPYFIVSQIMLSLFEESEHIQTAILMMQREVANRVCAKTRTKSYGILSVMAQLHSTPHPLFEVQGDSFRPKPDVTSTVVRFDFERHPELNTIDPGHLRSVVRAAFQQRRKTLRNSLKLLMKEAECPPLPDQWSPKRPEELPPPEFLELTRHIFGSVSEEERGDRVRVWRSKRNKGKGRER